MGDSQHDPRRRYARPGEFELPELENRISILESSSFNQRLGGQLNRSIKAPTAPSVELRPAVELNPAKRPLSPPPPEVRPNAGLNSIPRSAPPAAPQARLSGGLNSVPRSLALAPRPVRPVGEFSIQQRVAPIVKQSAIGTRRVSARFALLPDPPSKLNRLGWSAFGQLAFLGLLLLGPTLFPQQMQTALKFDVVPLMQPITHINIDVTPKPEPPPPPKAKPKVPPPQPKPIVPKPKQAEVEPPELNPRQPHVFLVLKPEIPKARKVDEKPVDLKPVIQAMEIVLTSKQPKRPKEELKAPNFQPMRKEEINAPGLGLGSLPATVLAAVNKVQTGGFGDLHGIPGPANPNKAATINRAGSPNLPGGPGVGNGTGGAQGVKGTVASDGSKGGAPATGATGGVSSSVNILYEPNPSYTTEARMLKMEGDVVLEVVFLASGQLQVTRVVSGLGHGLDEAAIQAAKQIRFRPAIRNGQPVDFPAHVRIEFRLAK